MSKENNIGRPTVMTADIIGKLEYAFAQGASDKSACFYAGINPDTLYEYQKKNPEFAERKQQLKQSKLFKALDVIHSALENGDVAIARWYLERKCPEEFGLNKELEPLLPVIKYVTPEQTAATDAHIDEFIGNE